MSPIFRHSAVKISLLAALVLGVALLIGTPFASRQELDRTARLLGPGGMEVHFTQDLTDTSMSAVRQGEAVYPASFDGDVRDLPQIGPSEKSVAPEFDRVAITGGDPNFVDPVLQTSDAPNAMPAASVSFAGLDLTNWGAGWPPDTQGDVGPNHYIQAVNTSIGIYNKSGSQLAAFTFDTLFTGTGTSCDADNNGDPVVIYDRISGRWIVADFGWTNTGSGPYYMCFAVSKTADPVSGGWWFYALRADDSSHPWLNDYPKIGAWHDGFYMTANMFDCLTSTCSSASYKGVRVWAIRRDEMINGQALNVQLADLGSAYYSLLPSHANLATPPAGTPNYMMSAQTSTAMYTWKLAIDFNNVANSTLTGPLSTSIASWSTPSNVPQLGSSITLDTLGDRLMAQLQWTNIGGTTALWATQSVSTSSRAGIRWYEFRNLSGTPSVFQSGTYSPDSTHRWMGSLAVDSQGNMAVMYSASSSSINPQIRYAGRLAGDAAGTLGQGEATLIAGTGSQTTYNRWGDYAAMSVDPTDGCTFWFTTEYYISTGTNWQTRVGAFTFPGCSGGPTPTPGPTATATPTPVPPTSTGYRSPSANAALSGGDNNGYQTNPVNAYQNDSVFAVDTNSGNGTSTSCTSTAKDKHRFSTFSFGLSSGTIQGIEVRLDARVDATGGSPKICVQLSWDGGVTWTTAKQTATLTTSEASYILGGPTDTWGRSWLAAELADGVFMVRVIDVASNTSRDFSLDWVAVNVYYAP
jgi:hypothetical protein